MIGDISTVYLISAVPGRQFGIWTSHGEGPGGQQHHDHPQPPRTGVACHLPEPSTPVQYRQMRWFDTNPSPVFVLSYCQFWIYWVGVNSKFTIWPYPASRESPKHAETSGFLWVPRMLFIFFYKKNENEIYMTYTYACRINFLSK